MYIDKPTTMGIHTDITRHIQRKKHIHSNTHIYIDIYRTEVKTNIHVESYINDEDTYTYTYTETTYIGAYRITSCDIGNAAQQ